MQNNFSLAMKRSITRYVMNSYVLFSHAAGAWTYVMYLTVQTSQSWISNNTVTEVKMVEFNESNSPCLAFAFYDIVNDQFLGTCPSDWKIYLDNGKHLNIQRKK